MNDGYNADTLNGDLSQAERDEVMGRFRKRQLQLLVATDVAARGLDVDDILANKAMATKIAVITEFAKPKGMVALKGAKIIIEIPVRFINNEKSPGLKKGGVLTVVRNEVELKVTASAIPEKLEADLDGLEIGTSIKISSVKLENDVKPTITDRDFIIASVVAPAALTSEEETSEEEGDEETTEGETTSSNEEKPSEEAVKKEADEKATAEAEAKAMKEGLNKIRKNSCSVIKANFNSDTSINELTDKVNEITKTLDVLVNNASSFYPTPLDNASLIEWRDLTDTNATTPLFLTQALLRHLSLLK